MDRQRLIDKLLETRGRRERSRALRLGRDLVDVSLARGIKDTYYRSWTSAPEKTLNAASALELVAEMLRDNESLALARWVRGIADLTHGKLDAAIRHLDEACDLFIGLGREIDAAQTQIGKLIALALLGRYAEAARTGRRSLEIFERHGDLVSAGKVEKNLGNAAARQGKESAAKDYYLRARERFVAAGDVSELAMCDNSLANTFAELNEFVEAERYYHSALSAAREAQMLVTEAEIESSLGNLALFRGRYAEALALVERARCKYEELNMPHHTAMARLEIADIYLELNMAAEAAQMYPAIAASLKRLKMNAEEARARANYGRAARRLGDARTARREFERAADLYLKEQNPGGAASVKLAETMLELSAGHAVRALDVINSAAPLLAKTENPRLRLIGEWVRGEALKANGVSGQAKKVLRAVVTAARSSEQLAVAQSALNSLGSLAMSEGRVSDAKALFKRSVELTDQLRSPLAGDEFRMAFTADKLGSIENLAQIYLREGDLAAAFEMTEKARGRTLAESVNSPDVSGPDGVDPKLADQIEKLREELNWHYSRLSRSQTREEAAAEHRAIRKRERALSQLQLRASSGMSGKRKGPGFSGLETVQKTLGKGKVLLEYTLFDGRLGVFIVKRDSINHIVLGTTAEEVFALLDALQFQFGTMRLGRENIRRLLPELKRRADHYLGRLYDVLAAPVADGVVGKELVVVPAGPLHYVPFSALFDGRQYLIERGPMNICPSAGIWAALERRSAKQIKNSLLIGFADEKIPFVEREIRELKGVLPSPTVLSGPDATFHNYSAMAPDFGLLHIACHGQFRSDDPLFSSLHLADGFVTVRDVVAQRLKAALVTLSACETGVNKISAGEEILGLARGFLSAGVPSLLLSLWTVSDEAAARLMSEFYLSLQRGNTPAASLQLAQISFIRDGSHPYYWAPFVAIGK